MNWLRKLFGHREDVPAAVSIEPDPDMAPGKWSWACYDCETGGEGEDQQMRSEAMTHCLLTGHVTHGEHEE
jgi:hypothetical protein